MHLESALRPAIVFTLCALVAVACAEGSTGQDGAGGGDQGAGGDPASSAASGGGDAAAGGAGSASSGTTSTTGVAGSTGPTTVGAASSGSGTMLCGGTCEACACPSDPCSMCCAQHGKVDTCNNGTCFCY